MQQYITEMWSEYVWYTQRAALVVAFILPGIWVKFLSIQATQFAESVVRCYGLGFLEGYSIGVLISPQPDQEGNKLQRQKVLSFIYPIYNHNWRNISTIYIYNKTSIKRNILRGADKSLARPGRKQATTEDFEFHISYL